MNEETFESERNFPLILAYSLLSKTPVRVRVEKDRQIKKSMAKLLQSISYGSSHSTEGDYISFRPGALQGGEVAIKCEDEAGAYMPMLLVLCPFVVKPMRVRLRGVTNENICVDMARIAHVSVLRSFGVDGCEVVVKRRAFGPAGGGEVILSCPGPQKVSVVDLQKSEKIQKIRGLVISSRLCSIPTHTMTEKIKELLAGTVSLKVSSSTSNKLDSGPSPGFQCAVFAESKNGIYYAEQNGKGGTPDEAVTRACKELLKSIRRGGVFDKKLLYLALTMMALSSTNVSQLRICRVDDELQEVLGLLKRFFKFQYSISPSDDEYIISALGCGYTNISRSLR
jgi:RNA 3'-terminal phosphate cyclase-like protein